MRFLMLCRSFSFLICQVWWSFSEIGLSRYQPLDQDQQDGGNVGDGRGGSRRAWKTFRNLLL
jgi:hypothetical protein